MYMAYCTIVLGSSLSPGPASAALPELRRCIKARNMEKVYHCTWICAISCARLCISPSSPEAYRGGESGEGGLGTSSTSSASGESGRSAPMGSFPGKLGSGKTWKPQTSNPTRIFHVCVWFVSLSCTI